MSWYAGGMAFLKQFVREDDQPVTHDCGSNYSTFSIQEGGQVIVLSGFGYGIQEGDYLILTQGVKRETTRYKVEKIEYKRDPADLWFATARFAPRPLVIELES